MRTRWIVPIGLHERVEIRIVALGDLVQMAIRKDADSNRMDPEGIGEFNRTEITDVIDALVEARTNASLMREEKNKPKPFPAEQLHHSLVED